MDTARRSLVALLLVLLAGCRISHKADMITELLQEAKAKLAPDRRTVVFDVQGEMKGRTITLTGEVHDAALKVQLLRFLKEKGDYEIVDQVRTLPDPELGEKTLAVASVSVVNIRTKPEHAAEMGTQAILGTPLKVLKKEHGGWLYVQTPDEYLGWTDDIIELMTHEEYSTWVSKPKVIVTTEVGFTRGAKQRTAQPVSDIVAGAILGLEKEFPGWYEVSYPDGRKAFLDTADAARLTAWLASAKDTPARIVATAKRFFGVPYFWGGTSAKCMDCSGFTKTVYFLNGVLLPRDASQQALVGDPVQLDDQKNGLQAGDLLFFGARGTESKKERVTHVAIAVGGKKFIHASGDVRINSLDPADPEYSAGRDHSFLRVKRIIGAGESSGVRRLSQIPYYRGNE